jgi:hypothetical protein
MCFLGCQVAKLLLLFIIIIIVCVEKSPNIYFWVLACSQFCEGCLNFFTLYVIYNEIWLNCRMDDCQLKNITKMKKTNQGPILYDC